MISQSVQDAIKGAIEMGDFSALYDYFADDVELKVAMAVGSPVPDERCKRSVVASLRRLGEAHLRPTMGRRSSSPMANGWLRSGMNALR